jgi:hypothetical protein
MSISVNVPEKRITRGAKHHAQIEKGSTDMDADGEDEIVRDDDDADEEYRFTGPGAVAAALTKATESKTPRPRGRLPKSTSAPPRASSSTSRLKPRPAMTSRTRQNNNVSDTRASKRTIKPTAKATLLSPSKIPMTILSRPIRADAYRRARMHAAKIAGARNELDAVIIYRALAPRAGERNRSHSPKEVFDGVVLKKRVQTASIIATNGDAGNGLAVQLDEFVANGLVGQQGHGLVDPVLGQDDMSSLGGSNKGEFCSDFTIRVLTSCQRTIFYSEMCPRVLMHPKVSPSHVFQSSVSNILVGQPTLCPSASAKKMPKVNLNSRLTLLRKGLSS